MLDKSKPQFQIEKNVAITPLSNAGQNNVKYPFRKMEIGDSFVASPAAQGAAYAWGKKNGRAFKCRAVGDGQIRIWRMT